MVPVIGAIDEVHLAGLAFEPEATGWDKVLVLLHELAARRGEIAGQLEPGVYYGLIERAGDAPGALRYVAGVAVDPAVRQPDGLVATTIPAGLYATFTVDGGVAAIGPAYQEINQVWLPSSGYREARCGAVEVYGERFRARADCQFAIRVAVEPVD